MIDARVGAELTRATHLGPPQKSPAPAQAQGHGVISAALPFDLSRAAYCVLGIPIDALDMAAVVRRIEAAAANRAAFFISTPNLNFLVNSRTDPEFRESLLDSDLCPADGTPIVWIARLIGVPIKTRVSGADTFATLQSPGRCARRLSVFLFGGAQGVAAAAASSLNAGSNALHCVGFLDPGFGSVEDMSRDEIIERVNASNADFLVVSLGAKKGQLWLLQNHRRLTIPVRAHLGAAINFEAGTIRRAPVHLRACGLEWLWRIKEEPHLWRRYWHDGGILLRLLFTRVLPLALANRFNRLKWTRQPQDLTLTMTQNHDFVTISLCGDATEQQVEKAIAGLQATLTARSKLVLIDLSSARVIDQRFFGLLLMLRRQLKEQGATLGFVGMSPRIKRMFRRNELAYLLGPENGLGAQAS